MPGPLPEFLVARAAQNFAAGNEGTILVDATKKAVVVTLPVPRQAALRASPYNIRKSDPTTNPVVIIARGGALIDGAPLLTLTKQWESANLFATETEYFAYTRQTLSAGGNVLLFRKNSAANVGPRGRLNLIEGIGITLSLTDDPLNDEAVLVIEAAGGSSARKYHRALAGSGINWTMPEAFLAGTEEIIRNGYELQRVGAFTGSGVGQYKITGLAVTLGEAMTAGENLKTHYSIVADGRLYHQALTGSGVNWVLGAVPTLGTEQIIRNGGELQPVGSFTGGGIGQYQIAGANVTLGEAMAAGEVLWSHYS